MFHMLLRWYHRHRVLSWVVAGLFVFYNLAGFVGAPLIIRHILDTRVSAALQRKVHAARVRVNPFTFTVRATGLSVSERQGGPFLRIGELAANLDPLWSLFKWGAVIQSIRIVDPHMRIIRTSGNKLNFSDLLPPSTKKSAGNDTAESEPMRIVIGLFRLAGGEIQFIDNTPGSHFESVFSRLEVTLSRLDTKPAAEAFSFSLSANTASDEHLDIAGQVDLQPLNAQAEVALKNLAPAKYTPYYHTYLNARIEDGRIDLLAGVRWSEQIRSVNNIMVAVSNFVLNDATGQKNLVKLPQLNLDGAGIDFEAHRIQLGKISLKNSQVHIQRTDQGQLDLLSAFAPPDTGPSGASASPPGRGGAAGRPAWEILAPDSRLENGRIDFEDLQPATPFRINLHDIALNAKDLSTRQQAEGRIDLNMGLGDKGRLSVQGGVMLIPLQAKLEVAADAVDVRPLQPYLEQFVRLVVTKGDLSARGRLQLAPGEISPGKSRTGITFAGQASLNNFAAVDAFTTEPFSNWKSLFLTGIEISTVPLVVKIDQVALTDFFNRVAIEPDGTANIETVIGQRPDGEASQAPPGKSHSADAAAPGGTDASDEPKADIRIKTVTLQGGKIDFSDRHIKPQVRMVMTKLGGRISGLDNVKQNKADVLLSGMVGGNTPLEIKGQVNPLIDKPFVDLNLTIPGIDLSPFGPYSGEYLGYTLEKGQLAFTLAYKVADNKLVGENKIQINQLTFGDSVPSPQATKLPVKLAVALLKDREGNIDLNLPVKGDLDDPEFSLGGVILKMFVNLLTEIVSAPFKMLGALFGGGQELSYLAFDPGQSTITPEGLKKLDSLAKVLYERPGLNLEIQGQADPDKDTDSLRRMQFEKNLKASKLKALLAAGRKATPLDQVEITPTERETMIRESFDAATFPKPRDEKGRLKILSPPEMEKLLYTAIAISPDDLRQLAYQRADAAKEYLLATGHIEARRLFVVEPIIESRKTGKDEQPQVRFSLK